MCINVVLPSLEKLENKEIEKEVFQQCWDNNDDGAGFMFVKNIGTPESSVVINKGYMKFKRLWKAFNACRHANSRSKFVVHFRYTSKGSTSVSNCHPFWVIPNVLGMAHNGTIFKMSDAKKNEGPSDSALFADFLSKLPPTWYNNRIMREMVEDYVGEHNKLAFLIKNNSVFVCNKDAWIVDQRGIWFSNDYFKISRYPLTDQAEKKTHIQDTRVIPFRSDVRTYHSSLIRCERCRELLIDDVEVSTGICNDCVGELNKASNLQDELTKLLSAKKCTECGGELNQDFEFTRGLCVDCIHKSMERDYNVYD